MKNRLEHIKRIGEIDYYIYHPTVFALYYKEKNSDYSVFHVIRMLANLICGGYVVYYSKIESNKIVGYCVVSRGGDGLKFHLSKI